MICTLFAALPLFFAPRPALRLDGATLPGALT
jgi:hypothetical protein